jgi:hypothetical protein
MTRLTANPALLPADLFAILVALWMLPATSNDLAHMSCNRRRRTLCLTRGVRLLEAAVFKLLLVFPLMLVAGTLVVAGVPLLLAFLPVALAVGAGVFAIVLVFAVLGLLFRVFAGLLIVGGGLLVASLGLGFAVAGGLALFALGFAMLHLLLPVLLIVGLIWLIKRASHPASPPALPAAHP